MSTVVEEYDDVVRVVHQPGNGTRYEAVGVKLPDDFPDHGGMWLIAFPLIGTAYYFVPGCYVSTGYLDEKLGQQRNGLRVCEVDVNEMAKMVAKITGGSHRAITDESGRIPTLRIVS